MEQAGSANLYFIWGIDDAPYGPVELPVLLDWIKDERVLADTWVFARSAGNWQRAGDIADLKKHFGSASQPAFNKPAGKGITPGMLRRIKILADLNDAQLAHLSDFMELQEVLQWAVIFKQGDASDSMYLILDGELRARTMSSGKETILSTFGPGDFFGDMALFDHGPRSADVVANVDSTVLKFSTTAFNRLMMEAPGLAAPFLQATAKTMAARIRADNKRLDRITQQFQASGS